MSQKSTSIIKPSIKTELHTGRFIIPYRIYGDKGQALICLNGIQQSMAIWSNFVQRFSRTHRIILFDFPYQGKGRVAKGEEHVSLIEQVEILGAVLKAAAVSSKVIICSASWGGVVAASFTVHNQDKVKILIMAGLGTRPNKKMLETIKEGTNLPLENRKEIAKKMIDSFGQELPLDVQNRIINQFERMSHEALKSFYRHGLLVIKAGSLSDVIDLRRIHCKTILLRGEKDTIIDAEDVSLLASQIPHAQVYTIKGAGHFLHMENDSLLDTYESILNTLT